MRRLWSALLGVLLLVAVPAVVLAATYSATVTVTENTTSTSYDMLPLGVSVNNTYLANTGVITPSGLDTRVKRSTDELPHMLADNATFFALPVDAGTQYLLNYDTGETPLDIFSIITGYGGYITTSDNETIELSDNFTIEASGHFDTDNGTDKNILFKEGACELFVSENVSENVTFNIGTHSWINPTGFQDPDSYWTNEANAYDSSVSTSASQNGFVQNTWNSPIILTCNATYVDRLRFFRASDANDASVTSVNLSAYYSGAYHIIHQGAFTSGTWNAYSIGSTELVTAMRISYYVTTGSGAPQPMLAEAEFGGGTLASVSATGVDSGKYTILVSANSTHLSISVDGLEEDSIALAGGVPDNSADWLWMQNNVMPYADNITIDVGGVEKLYYAPNTMIIDSVLPDRTGNNDGTITWGTNPAGIEIVLGGLLPTSSSSASPPSGVTESTFVPPVSLEPQVTGTEGTNLPLYGLFKGLFDSYETLGGPHIPMANFWKLVAVIIGWAVGTSAMMLTRNVVIGLVGYLVGFAVPAFAMTDPILDIWVPVVYGIGAICLSALLWKWSSSSVG